MAALLGVLNAVDTPLRQSLLSQFVDDRQDLPNALALNAMLFTSSRFIGPPLAGLLLAVVSEAVCFALNGASYLALVIGLLCIQLPASPRHRAGRQRRGVTAMPLYAFENKERDLELDVYLPINGIVDEIVLRRRTVPDRVGITGLAPTPTQGAQVLETFRRLESDGNVDLRKSEYTPQQIKAAWADEQP